VNEEEGVSQKHEKHNSFLFQHNIKVSWGK